MFHFLRHLIGPVSLTLLFRRHLIIRHDANDDNDRCLSVECLADMSIPDDPIKDLLQLVTCTAGVAPSPSDALFSFIVLLRSSVGVSPSPSPHRACLSYSCSPSSNHSTTTTTITTATTQLRTCHQPCEPDRACVCPALFRRVSLRFAGAHGIHNLPCATKLRLWMGRGTWPVPCTCMCSCMS